MKSLFKPTISALRSEFQKLGMQEFLSNNSKLKPLYYFGEGKALKSPYSLSSLRGKVQAGGHSPINLAVNNLFAQELHLPVLRIIYLINLGPYLSLAILIVKINILMRKFGLPPYIMRIIGKSQIAK